MEDGPPIFRQDVTCPALLIELTTCAFLCTGLSPFTFYALSRNSYMAVKAGKKITMIPLETIRHPIPLP